MVLNLRHVGLVSHTSERRRLRWKNLGLMALIPPGFLDSVVAIERPKDDGGFATVASGVIVGFDTGESDEDKNTLYRVYLVTDHHVFEGATDLWARFSKGLGEDRHQLKLADDEKPRWRHHPTLDVAAIPLNVQLIDALGTLYLFLAEDQHTFTLSAMEELGISVGDGVFALGFPMGLSGAERKRTIVRTGCIARLDSEVVGQVGGFLIDATIFPGNSGGPVFNVPTHIAIQGTNAVGECRMIGIVSSYLPYEDVAISQQTGRQRIVFQENSGLASVVPFDAVKEVAELFFASPTLPGTDEQVVTDDDAASE